MDMIDALIKRLVEDEDLFKDSSNRRINMIKDYLRVTKDPKLSPEQRNLAYRQARSIADTGKEEKFADEKASKLEELMIRAKGKTASDADRRLADIAARAGIKVPKERVKEAPATPGSDATLTQLQASAKRARRDPKDFSEKQYDKMNDNIFEAPGKLLSRNKPEQAARLLMDKYRSKAKESVELANKLHGMGDIDSAHELYSAIPKNHLPKELHDYNPDYMHYGMHPAMWSHEATTPDIKQVMHDTHKQAMAGELDNHPDYKNIIPKLKASKIPLLKTWTSPDAQGLRALDMQSAKASMHNSNTGHKMQVGSNTNVKAYTNTQGTAEEQAHRIHEAQSGMAGAPKVLSGKEKTDAIAAFKPRAKGMNLQDSLPPKQDNPDEQIMSMPHHSHFAQFGVTPELWDHSTPEQRRAVLEYYASLGKSEI